jgi:hypothetical protein
MPIDLPIVLTADEFERFDGYEAYVSFDIPRHLPDPFVLWVWGARIDLDVEGASRCYYSKDYVPLTFSGVERLEVEMLLYGERGSFLHDSEGNIVTLKRAWGKEDPSGARRYSLESVCIWPFSRCELAVSCRGSVAIDLRGARLIPEPTPADLEDPPELRGDAPAGEDKEARRAGSGD